MLNVLGGLLMVICFIWFIWETSEIGKKIILVCLCGSLLVGGLVLVKGMQDVQRDKKLRIMQVYDPENITVTHWIKNNYFSPKILGALRTNRQGDMWVFLPDTSISGKGGTEIDGIHFSLNYSTYITYPGSYQKMYSVKPHPEGKSAIFTWVTSSVALKLKLDNHIDHSLKELDNIALGKQ